MRARRRSERELPGLRDESGNRLGHNAISSRPWIASATASAYLVRPTASSSYHKRTPMPPSLQLGHDEVPDPRLTAGLRQQGKEHPLHSSNFATAPAWSSFSTHSPRRSRIAFQVQA